jgi:hypothetical protein
MIAENMSPEDLKALEEEAKAEGHAPQEAVDDVQDLAQADASPDDVVEDLAQQVAAPAAPTAPAIDPALLQILQAQQRQLEYMSQQLAPKAPQIDPLAALEARLPEKYRGDKQLLEFVQVLTSLQPEGDTQVREELAQLKQAMYAEQYKTRNNHAVTQNVIASVLKNQADPELSSMLGELNFAFSVIEHIAPEQAAARQAHLIEKIGQAYVKAKGLAVKAAVNARKDAPKAVPVTASASQVPQDTLDVTAADLAKAHGNPVSAVFNAFRRGR